MFSESVDNIIKAAGNRTDMIPDVTRYLNQILKRVHAKRHWDRDFKTQVFGPESCRNENSYVWERPKDFRKLRTVRVNGCTWLDYERVGRHLSHHNKHNYYYAAEESFVFVSSCIQTVEVGYYSRPPNFRYYPKNERPAFLDENCVWQFRVQEGNNEPFYHTELETDFEMEEAQSRVYSWLLDSWSETMEEGALNLLYVQMGNEKAAGTFAIFRDSLKDLIRQEGHSSTDN